MINTVSLKSYTALAFLALVCYWPASLFAAEEEHYTYVLVHGASGGGWDWRTMDDLLTANGHSAYRPTLTGLGEKAHLADPEIDLTTTSMTSRKVFSSKICTKLCWSVIVTEV